MIFLYTNYFYAFKFKIIFAAVFSYTYINIKNFIKNYFERMLNVKQVPLFPGFNGNS